MSWCERCEGERSGPCDKETKQKYSCPYLKQDEDRSTLKTTEPHPAYVLALDYIQSIPYADLMMYREAFATNAIEGNRLAEICLGTLSKLLNNEPVSDRYLFGLAWVLMKMEGVGCVDVTTGS